MEDLSAAYMVDSKAGFGDDFAGGGSDFVFHFDLWMAGEYEVGPPVQHLGGGLHH